MGRHSAHGSHAASAGAVRSPPGSARRVALAAALACLGVVFLIIGVVSWNSAPPDTEPAQAGSSSGTPATSTAPATESSTPRTPRPGTTFTPTGPVVLPVTVLNNSPVEGLAARVAAVLEAAGWPIADLLNYSDTQVPDTTVFFTPGNADEEAAAQALASQFPEITGGAAPRFEGLAGAGLTLAAVGDWLP